MVCARSVRTPDTIEHRVRWCPRFGDIRRPHQWVCDAWDSLPTSLTHHLLPSANPHLPALRKLLCGIADTTGVFFCSGIGDGWQHVFTDGSCFDFDGPDFFLAGWGMIHAATGQAIACGVVPGLLQTAPRAELTAMIAAAKWAIHTQQPCMVWTDAQNIADGVQALQAGQSLQSAADSDLWEDLAHLLHQLVNSNFQVRHTPSHLDSRRTESPFEDWLAEHNAHADTLAVLANSNRPQALRAVHAEALRYHNDVNKAMRALRSIFFGIADKCQHEKLGHRQHEDAEEEFQAPPVGTCPRQIDLEDVLPINWREQVELHSSEFPSSFAVQVCGYLFLQDASASEAHALSWLELVFMLHNAGITPYPACDNQGKWVDVGTLAFPPPAHTVAVRLSLLRRVVRPVLRDLGLEGLFTHSIDLSGLGVGFSLDGLVIGVSTSDVLRARTCLGRFVQGRAAHCKAVLARPI